MPVKLPRFDDTQCQMLTVCARVKTKNASLRRHMATKREMCASYRPPGGRAYIRASLAPLYLHVDCALGRAFPEGFTPKVTHKKREVLDLIEVFFDVSADIRVAGVFRFALDEWLQRSLLGSVAGIPGVGGKTSKIQVERLRVSFRDASITHLGWELCPDGENVRVELGLSPRGTTIDDRYVVNALAALDRLFTLSFKEGSSDGSRSETNEDE